MDMMMDATADVNATFEPSSEDRAYEIGYAIGRETGRGANHADLGYTHGWTLDADERAAFYRGTWDGRVEHARRIGFDLGERGQPCDRPAAVGRLFDRYFVAGWEAGAEQLARDRDEVMGEWSERDEWEADREIQEREREFALLAREAGGWYRMHPTMVD